MRFYVPQHDVVKTNSKGTFDIFVVPDNRGTVPYGLVEIVPTYSFYVVNEHMSCGFNFLYGNKELPWLKGLTSSTKAPFKFLEDQESLDDLGITLEKSQWVKGFTARKLRGYILKNFTKAIINEFGLRISLSSAESVNKYFTSHEQINDETDLHNVAFVFDSNNQNVLEKFIRTNPHIFSQVILGLMGYEDIGKRNIKQIHTLPIEETDEIFKQYLKLKS